MESEINTGSWHEGVTPDCKVEVYDDRPEPSAGAADLGDYSMTPDTTELNPSNCDRDGKCCGGVECGEVGTLNVGKARYSDPLTRLSFDIMGATLAIGLTILLIAAFARTTVWILGF